MWNSLPTVVEESFSGMYIVRGLLGELAFRISGRDIPNNSQSLKEFARDRKIGFRNSIQKRVQFAAVYAHDTGPLFKNSL